MVSLFLIRTCYEEVWKKDHEGPIHFWARLSGTLKFYDREIT